MQPEQAITSGNYHITKPRKALKKAFLKVKPNPSQIERFKDHLKELPDRTNNIASEEFHKNLVTDFLKKTYYEPDHFVTTKGWTDRVTHKWINIDLLVHELFGLTEEEIQIIETLKKLKMERDSRILKNYRKHERANFHICELLLSRQDEILLFEAN